jgi:hypothetical protein
MEGRSPKKIKVGFYIDRRLYDEFRRLAFTKSGRLHGALSYELEQALLNWLGLHTQMHTNSKGGGITLPQLNPQPKAARVWEQVRYYLKRRFGYLVLAGAQVNRAHLVDAIEAIRGSDPRTVRKWLEEFMKYKLIKPVSAELYEVV